MPRVVSVWLRRWPIIRFLRAQASGSLPPGTAPVDAEAPFALAAEGQGGPRLVAVNRAAAASGVAPGDRLADARAKAGPIQIRPADPEADGRALAALALWATRYAPGVAPWREAEGSDGFFVDVTGASHLLGGEAALVGDLQSRLAGFGLPACLALAETPGAAWALARFGSQPRMILTGGEEEQALAPLPVEALRLDAETCATLRRLGLRCIGDLLGKPRAPLSGRFGPILLERLDQACGRAPEALDLVAPPPVYTAMRQVLDPLTTRQALVAVAGDLMREVAVPLARDGLGAQRLRLGLYRVDGASLSLALGLAQPTRDAAHVARLLDLRLDGIGEALDAGFGFEAVRLAVSEAAPLRERQAGFDAAADAGPARACAAAIDVLRQRMGTRRLRRLARADSHIPERAGTLRRLSGADLAALGRRHPGRPPGDGPVQGKRPLLLLARAEPAEVVALVPEGPPRQFRWRGVLRRVAQADGPERIAPEWWRRREPQPTRDYYVVEDETGRRFWLFREGLYGREPGEPRWFVHGLFA
jgi:protein ImuB